MGLSSWVLLLSISCSCALKPVVINTWASDGFQQANRNALGAIGGGRMYALVEGLSTCEKLQCDTTVGYGGSPDESGETTLDALVVDGSGVRMGAVANLHRIKDAARVAWAVMNYTKHTLLVGESATRFAIQMGFSEEDISSNVSRAMISEWRTKNCQPNFWQNVLPDPSQSCGPYRPSPNRYHGGRQYNRRRGRDIDRFNHDTLGMVVLDSAGNVAAGTSTNGAKFKIPGRVGDSPIPGSGAYAAEGVGGASATGDGDVMMRFLPSFYAVEQMRLGTKPFRAAHKAMKNILQYYPNFQGAIVAVNVRGLHGAACANLHKFQYSLGVGSSTRVETVACVKLPTKPRKNLRP
ncbi:unnamed protein product [Cylicocyclus nassatus]|uniref:N(4)-(beta-N-acetylglucosaminyl)-L-asparaginase n=1 Tax=Cylicocyclus nassatus TaxID=53992 RepID=A0AA36HET7_CYLNA|nr:unnamed protein product [Cylicocyclus nassatus]